MSLVELSDAEIEDAIRASLARHREAGDTATLTLKTIRAEIEAQHGTKFQGDQKSFFKSALTAQLVANAPPAAAESDNDATAEAEDAADDAASTSTANTGKRKRTGFAKDMMLVTSLADFMGAERATRAEVRVFRVRGARALNT